MKQLLIAHDYEPYQGAESIQNTRICKALARVGVETTVLTRTIKNSHSVLPVENIKIVRAKTFENKVMKGLIYIFARDYIHFPDTKWTWVFPALRKAEKLLATGEYNLVHSWSSPLSSHLVALKMRRKHKFHWIAHFSDPWTDNPYVKYENKHVKAMNLKWEREVIENADILTFTSKETVELIMRKYGDQFLHKTHILPHTYDTRLVDKYSQIKRKENVDKIVFAHVGNFYGKRVPDDFIKGVELACKDEEVSRKLLVKFIGKIDMKYLKLIKDKGLQDNFHIMGTIPYDVSQMEMASADVLINIDADDEVSVFLPSKLIEYLAYQKPIIALSSLVGTTARLLKENGHMVIPNHLHQTLSKQLTEICKAGPQSLQFNRSGYLPFHPDTVALQLKDILHSIGDKNE